MEIEDRTAALRALLASEVEAYLTEPDIRIALARRERASATVRSEADAVNARVRRLNLIAPLDRFQRAPLDALPLLESLRLARRQPLIPGGTLPSAPAARGPGTPRNS